jgi:hypothetical protein
MAMSMPVREKAGAAAAALLHLGLFVQTAIADAAKCPRPVVKSML